jgi:hypothetical protein
MPAFALTWLTAATIVVGARFYLRAKKQAGPFGLDDLFMAIAWVSHMRRRDALMLIMKKVTGVGFTACACVNTIKYDVSRHVWDIPVPLWVPSVMWGWIAEVLNVVSTGATKMSVLLFYRRMVADTITRRWRIAIYAMIGFHAFTVVGTLIALLTVCRPLVAYWASFAIGLYHHPYTCIPALGLNLTAGSLSVFGDAYAVILPCLILNYYELDIPRKQKIALDCLFALGLLVVGAGIAKTYFLYKLATDLDASWTGFNLYVASIIECDLAMICASAPSLRALVRRYLASSSRNRSIARSGGGSAHSRPEYNPNYKERNELDMRELTKPSVENMHMERHKGWEFEAHSPTDYNPSTRGASPTPITWEKIARPGSRGIMTKDFATTRDLMGKGSVKEMHSTV